MMEDSQRKTLMVFLGEYCPACSKNEWRSFFTPYDQQACKDALAREGFWKEFFQWGMRRFDLVALCPDEKQEGCYESDYIDWLFRPVDENGEPHFCRLVCDFLESKK